MSISVHNMNWFNLTWKFESTATIPPWVNEMQVDAAAVFFFFFLVVVSICGAISIQHMFALHHVILHLCAPFFESLLTAFLSSSLLHPSSHRIFSPSLSVFLLYTLSSHFLCEERKRAGNVFQLETVSSQVRVEHNPGAAGGVCPWETKIKYNLHKLE